MGRYIDLSFAKIPKWCFNIYNNWKNSRFRLINQKDGDYFKLRCGKKSTRKCISNWNIQLFYSFYKALNLFCIMISASSCKTLDPAWKNIVVEPSLPVPHGQEITLSCPADHVNEGSNQATCQDGTLVPTDTPPLCSFGSCFVQYFLIYNPVATIKFHLISLMKRWLVWLRHANAVKFKILSNFYSNSNSILIWGLIQTLFQFSFLFRNNYDYDKVVTQCIPRALQIYCWKFFRRSS